jgi:hypothetical protein
MLSRDYGGTTSGWINTWMNSSSIDVEDAADSRPKFTTSF